MPFSSDPIYYEPIHGSAQAFLLALPFAPEGPDLRLEQFGRSEQPSVQLTNLVVPPHGGHSKTSLDSLNASDSPYKGKRRIEERGT
jgi:hypothetical protein